MVTDNRITKEDINDVDFVDADELLSDGYTIYRTNTLATTAVSRTVVIVPSFAFDSLINVDNAVEVGDIVSIYGNAAAGLYTVESITNDTDFVVVESISSSVGGSVDFIYPAGATKVGFDPSNTIFITSNTVQGALEEIAAGAIPTGPAGGDLDGYYPNPTVQDLTISGEQQGSVLHFDGTNWVSLDPGSDGYVLTTHGVGMDPTWEEVNSLVGGVVLFGDNGVTATTTTRYLSPGVSGGNALTSAISLVVPRDGTLQNLYIRHNFTNGNGNAIVYTVRINGVGSALTVSLASTTAVGSDLVNTVFVNQGDTVDIEVTKAIVIGNSPGRIVASMEFV